MVKKKTLQDASRIHPLRGVLVMSHSADAERLTKDFLDGLHTVAEPPNNTNTDERVE